MQALEIKGFYDHITSHIASVCVQKWLCFNHIILYISFVSSTVRFCAHTLLTKKYEFQSKF
jgi:hypothetical protein